jgi:branched-chain amino acid transport system substrate-binding protein
MKTPRPLFVALVLLALAAVASACSLLPADTEQLAATAEAVVQEVAPTLQSAATTISGTAVAAATEVAPTLQAAATTVSGTAVAMATEVAPTLDAAATRVVEAATQIAPTVDAAIEDIMTENCQNTYEGETLTVYQSAGLTGPLAQIFGDGFINGSKDAVARINEGGGVCGIQLEIRLEDSQYDPEQELAIYERFRAEDPPPAFVLTYGSGAAIALKDRVIEDKIPNLTAGLSADAFYLPRDGYTYGVGPIYSDQFAGFIQWLSDNWATVKPEGAGDDIVVGVVGWANAFGAGATTPEALAFAESLGVTVLPLEQQEVSPTADVTGQIQNLLASGANVIYAQSLSFGPAQVISTLRALNAWDSVVVGGVNWAMNTDVLNILGENAELMEGFYGVFPYLWWNDEGHPGVQQMTEDYVAGGYPDADRGVSYIISYAEMFAIRQILIRALNTVGLEGLNGEAFASAMQEIGTPSALGIYTFDARGENRAPNRAQIRQTQLVDGTPEFVVVQDFFELPDTRPPAP